MVCKTLGISKLNSALLIIVYSCTLLCGCYGCLGSNQSKSSSAKVVLEIDWDASKDLRGDFPSIKVSGPLLTHDPRKPYVPVIVTLTRKSIRGTNYRGVVVYKISSKSKPRVLLVEILARRFQEPNPQIDIYLTCKVPCKIIIKNFDKGSLRDGKTGKIICKPLLFKGGIYHIQAIRSKVTKANSSAKITPLILR